MAIHHKSAPWEAALLSGTAATNQPEELALRPLAVLEVQAITVPLCHLGDSTTLTTTVWSDGLPEEVLRWGCLFTKRDTLQMGAISSKVAATISPTTAMLLLMVLFERNQFRTCPKIVVHRATVVVCLMVDRSTSQQTVVSIRVSP